MNLLQKEKIDDQKEIIQLKDKVIAKKSDDLNEVKFIASNLK
jgi:hypothetical protein